MNEKLNKISRLLSEYEFTNDNDVDDKHKCVFCKEILNNAHQAICGCNFCLKCINELIENGTNKCPGDSEECKFGNLSNIAVNHIKNIQISKLALKCPHENCTHKYKLIEMEEHLRFCSMKSVKCIFHDIGCQSEEMPGDQLNTHFLSNIESHSKILIELIGQLRNEVRELKDGEETNRLEILKLRNDINLLKNENEELKTTINVNENLRCKLDEMENKINQKFKNESQLSIKDEINESMKKEINLIKADSGELKALMRNSNNNLWKKLDEIEIEVNKKCVNDPQLSINDHIETMKIDNHKIADQIKSLEGNCRDFGGKLKEIQQIKDENEKRKKEINLINTFLIMQHDGQLSWQIGKVNEIKSIWSEFFSDRRNPYKMQLRLSNSNEKLNMWLWAYSSPFDASLSWPLKAKLTINIYPLSNTHVFKSMKQQCVISKPDNDSQERSDVMSFTHVDLASLQLLDKDATLVCTVKFH